MRAPVQYHTWVATSPISTAAAGLWTACENRICPEVFMQIVQHERGLCVKSFHVFWQTCVFPDFSDWSPRPLTVTRAQKPKKTAPVAMRTMSVVRFTSCSCSWASASKKKKKKKPKQKSNFHSDLWEKQIRNGIHANIYVKATKVIYPGPMVPE